MNDFLVCLVLILKFFEFNSCFTTTASAPSRPFSRRSDCSQCTPDWYDFVGRGSGNDHNPWDGGFPHRDYLSDPGYKRPGVYLTPGFQSRLSMAVKDCAEGMCKLSVGYTRLGRQSDDVFDKYFVFPGYNGVVSGDAMV